MNFLQATIIEDGKKVLFPDGNTIDLAKDLAEHADRRVTIGIRPEHLDLDESKSGTISQTVQVVEHLGADTLAHGTFGSGNVNLTVSLKGVKTIHQGEVLPLSIDAQNIHVFDTDSGHRL
jgi:sn-glycerol 3-phosphate transport system ATP-binding protein